MSVKWQSVNKYIVAREEKAGRFESVIRAFIYAYFNADNIKF